MISRLATHSGPVRPRVSLLIPMRNEARYIGKCLQSIFNQDYPAERLEILVMDGESTDNSMDIVRELITGRGNARLYKNPKITQSAAWNFGIAHSTGELIGIVSAHAELERDYVSQAVNTLQRTGAAMVGGPTRAYSAGTLGDAIAIALSTPFGVGGGVFHYTETEIEVDTVFMGVCRMETYRSIGGFDEDMVRNQDDELSYRLRKQGGTIVCNPAIRSRYYNRSTLRSLWRQYFQYGYWKVRVLQKHPRQMRLRQFVPAALVGAVLGTAALSLIASPAVSLLLLILASYLGANLIASSYAAARRGWGCFPALPPVFTALHFSYGLGFLLGLVTFAGRWSDRHGSVPKFSTADR
ncbi:MAG: glycosyltransferase family 2 protein [Anaerolineales bacterium]|nr:glycosyltransferase family 2 protein [Anaerolineales bacterium]